MNKIKLLSALIVFIFTSFQAVLATNKYNNSFLIGEAVNDGKEHILAKTLDFPHVARLHGLTNVKVEGFSVSGKKNSVHHYVIQGTMNNGEDIAIILFNAVDLKEESDVVETEYEAMALKKVLDLDEDEIDDTGTELIEITYYNDQKGFTGYDLSSLNLSSKVFYGQVRLSLDGGKEIVQIGDMTAGMKKYEFTLDQLYFDSAIKAYRLNVWGTDWIIGPQNRSMAEQLEALMQKKNLLEAQSEFSDLLSILKINFYGCDDNKTLYIFDIEDR